MRMLRFSARSWAALGLALATATLAAADQRVPTVDNLLTLKTIGGAQIAPDGGTVAYTVTEADFDQDAFVTGDLAGRRRMAARRIS